MCCGCGGWYLVGCGWCIIRCMCFLGLCFVWGCGEFFWFGCDWMDFWGRILLMIFLCGWGDYWVGRNCFVRWWWYCRLCWCVGILCWWVGWLFWWWGYSCCCRKCCYFCSGVYVEYEYVMGFYVWFVVFGWLLW